MTATRGETSQAIKNLLQYHTSTEEALRVVVDMMTDQNERLSRIEHAVQQLQEMELERSKREAARERNRLSAFFQQVAFTLSIVLFSSPVLVYLRDDPAAWLLSLLAAIAVTLAASVLTRRNGGG